MSWMFTRTGADGQKQSMATWERVYWGIGVMGLSAFLMSRSSYFMRNKEEEKDKVGAELKGVRLGSPAHSEFLCLVLMLGS